MTRNGRRARERPMLEITEAVWPLPDPAVHASWLDVEAATACDTGYALPIEGWLIGADSPVEAIEAGWGGLGVWRLGINLQRPDVQALHPDRDWAFVSGFRHLVSTLKLPPEFELEIGALLKDGTRVGILKLRGRRRPLPAPPARMKPVIVTTLGRTGSTWILSLLGEHPEVVAYRPFQYEAKLVRYWTDILGALSEPASYRQGLAPEIYSLDWFVGRDRQFPPAESYDPEVERWLAGPNVEELAVQCRTRIDRFYAETAASLGKPRARWFAEKMLPGTFGQQVLPELYPGSKEVFLVRDFRDMASSILDYDRRRHVSGFIRANGASDDDFVRKDLGRDIGVLADSWRRRSHSAFLLRYEDLVLDPERTLRALLEYLELDGGERVVTEMLRAKGPDVSHPQHQTSASAAQSIGRWREEEPSIREACEDAFADVLETFGYST